MKAAMVVTWKGSIPGRELPSLEYSKETSEYVGKLFAEGKCGPETWLMSPDGFGIWFVTGELNDLLEIQALEGTQRLIIKGTLLLADFRWGIFATGDSVQEHLGLYKDVVTKLGK